MTYNISLSVEGKGDDGMLTFDMLMIADNLPLNLQEVRTLGQFQ